MNFAIVVPWVTQKEIEAFLEHWHVPQAIPDWLILQHDINKEGCGATKNKGVNQAMERGAEMVVVLDGDCYPANDGETLLDFAAKHHAALEPQEVELFEAVTDPPSRGTPYSEHTAILPVAASMGFWTEIGDHCAVRQLATNNAPMEHFRKTVYWRWFPLCGMNIAFKPKEWMPWGQFIEVPRFDDIWMGWLWQREAYRRGYCFNLAGPLVRHSRQSNVWQNLREESVYLEKNETLWQDIATHESNKYEILRELLPC